MRHSVMRNASNILQLTALAASAMWLLLSSAGVEAASKQVHFATPREAVDTLVTALRKDDFAVLEAALGPDGADILYSGDAAEDKASRDRFLAAYDANAKLIERGPNKVILAIGGDRWPFPIPLTRDAQGWRLDTAAGREEILNRRIGENELSAAEACLAYVDAQREYASADYDGDKLNEYAQRFVSRPKTRDGLYWEAKPGKPESPLGKAFAVAQNRDSRVLLASGLTKDSAPSPYHGYRFKILTAQGSHARGGAHDYIVNGNMVGGFALVAYPAAYGRSGVMTFIVNHDGQVFQKNLGPRSAVMASAMTSFDPDSSWAKLETGIASN